MTNLTMPEAILLIGIAYTFFGRPLVNINRGWQWFDKVNNVEDNRKESKE